MINVHSSESLASFELTSAYLGLSLVALRLRLFTFTLSHSGKLGSISTCT